LVASIAVMQAGLISQEAGAIGLRALAPWVDRYPGSTIVITFTTWPYAGQRGLARELRSLPGVDAVVASDRLPNGGIQRRGGTLIVDNDGDPATLEAVRDQIAWVGEAHTIDQLHQVAEAEDSVASMRRALETITWFLLTVCAATLLVALVDWIMERRRALAVLSAVGVGGSVLRGSVVAQIAVPLATALVLGVAAGIVVSVLLYTATEIPVVIPIASLAGVAVAVGAVVLAVTGLSLPWVRMSQRPEYLRAA
jgi:predicted lysophospholipase L1 biosynthesis ABC-type transport system permease subunit